MRNRKRSLKEWKDQAEGLVKEKKQCFAIRYWIDDSFSIWFLIGEAAKQPEDEL